MGENRSPRYIAAIVASGISVLGWLGAVLGAGYTIYRAVLGSSLENVLVLTLVALFVGIWFARLERRLYSDE